MKLELKDTFGLSRVIEPINAVPVNAWKIDNSREISPYECRIAVEIVHLERDSFQQICSDCGFDDTRIKAKIIEITNKRGKLHNPFTKTGGVCYGMIEEMGEEYKKTSEYSVGDYLLCQTTLTAIPLHIETIHEIDFNYGEIFITGYAIAFLGSTFYSIENNEDVNYTMATIDESGSLYNIAHLVEENMKVMIIAKDLMSAVIYSGAIKKALQNKCYIVIVLDIDSFGKLTNKQVENILNDCADSVYIVDIASPLAAFKEITIKENDLMDFTINCEDMMGSEVLGVLMTKNKGKLYFTSTQNGYTQGIFTAESMGKELVTYSLDQYSTGYQNFTMELLNEIKSEVKKINRLYKTLNNSTFNERKELMAINKKAGQTDEFIYASKETESLINETINIASFDCNVIIQGETGVGKEMVLGLIHKNSERKSMPCIKINCATIQENLAESEFFGYEEGSFTGAKSGGKKGYFELANGGTLFLDEVGQLSLNLQSKLLRVLQENQFFRVGGVDPVNVNVRVVCANNIPLRQLVEESKFREDLYYRLNICTINIPPLRERRDDIGALAVAFAMKFCKKYNVEKEFDISALKRLSKYHWPGNVRELENTVHRIIINTNGYVITDKDIEAVLNEGVYDEILLDLRNTMRNNVSLDFNKLVESQEKKLITYGLKKAGSTRKAAELLNMTQAQLMRKKQKYGI
ncbi:MAG: sigma-54 dependent transcriptional regulator [Anaerovoracaceae bacterium]